MRRSKAGRGFSALVALVLVGVCLVSGCATSRTTIVLVRHAEKQTGPDPALTAEGETRAAALVEVLTDAGIDAVYTTPFARTRATAAPAARAFGLSPIELGVDGGAEEHASAVAATLLADQRGKRVLVVGHSNTVPLIIRALGGPASLVIDESEYDRFFVVEAGGDQPTTLIDARYGN